MPQESVEVQQQSLARFERQVNRNINKRKRLNSIVSSKPTKKAASSSTDLVKDPITNSDKSSNDTSPQADASAIDFEITDSFSRLNVSDKSTSTSFTYLGHIYSLKKTILKLNKEKSKLKVRNMNLEGEKSKLEDSLIELSYKTLNVLPT